jgi:hypothetical protein
MSTTAGPMEAQLNDQYEAWFAQLQQLSTEPLNKDDWVERWFDGFTPAEALDAGPESRDA